MALFRKFFYRKPPDGLLEISERVYVFDCCFTTDVLEDDDYKVYMGGIVSQLREHFPDASFMVFNFREGERQSQVASILSEYDMTVMDYPRHYEGCPLLTMEMVHHFLRSSESWLCLGMQNILLMHCERGGWPVLAFMLAALLIYRKQYTGEQRTLEMIYKQAPRELLQLLSPLNPLPSQMRYLQYVSRRNVGSEWPPLDRALTLDCVILRILPNFDGEGGCRPLFRIYGQDPFLATDRTPKVLFSMPKRSKSIRYYKQADCELVKIDIHCHIQGDVVLECISLDEDLEREEMMFRVMFNTAFIRSNILMLNRDEIDILWDAKDRFSKDFRAEVLLSDMDTTSSVITMDLATIEDKEGLPIEAFARVQEIFSNVDWLDPKGDAARQVLQQISSSNSLLDKLEVNSLYKVDPMQESSPMIKQKHLSEASDDEIRKSSPSSPKQQSLSSISWHLDVKATEQSCQNHDIQVPVQPKIMSQWVAAASQSTPTSRSNSFQNSPSSISRYHSAPSTLGITALLHDHAKYGNGESNYPAFPSSPSFSAVASRLLERSKPNNHVSPSVISTSIDLHPKSSTAPSPSPLVPPSTMMLPSVASSTPKSSKATSSQHPSPPPPPPLPPPLLPPSRIKSQQIPFQPALKQPSLPTPSSSPPQLPSKELAMLNQPTPPIPPPFPTRSPSKELPFPKSTSHMPTPHVATSSPGRGLTSSAPFAPPSPPPPPSLEGVFLPSITSMSSASATDSKTNKSPPLPPPPPQHPSVASVPPPPPPRPPTISSLPPPPPPPPTIFSVPPSPPTPPPPPRPPTISLAPPPPPPPPLAASTTPPPPPPPPAVSLAPAPPLFPPIPTPAASSAPSPPPPPPPPTPVVSSASSPPPLKKLDNMPHAPPPPPLPTSRPASTAPPPPPPPHLEPKNSASPSIQKSPHVPPVPPPPMGSLKAPTTMPGPPAPPVGLGPPMSAASATKGRNLTRSSSPRSALSAQSTSKKTSLKPLHWIKVTRAMQGSIWAETQKHDEASKAPEFDMSELESLFSAAVPTADSRGSGEKSRRASLGSKPEKIHLIDLRRANNCEIMLTKVKIPLPDLMSSLLALDDSVLDVDQIDNLIKFCPTKEEMELLKGFNGDKENLGKCEQFFLELMKVPRVESKLRVFSFKIQFRSQVADLSSNLNIVNSAADEAGSAKLKRIMQTILSLGNALNQGTARGSAIGFRLDSLLKLTDTRARNNKMTLMHYLCKVLADKLPELLDFNKDLVSLEAASKIQLKTLAEEMQAISKGLEKVEQELTASENDGPVSRVFCQVPCAMSCSSKIIFFVVVS
ncbi:hypothetical protein Taro_024664 [Colocasia esculenta]|uniref:Formin-like protein n=1 Tax=Colocasia esculenta TaxID=4460 RepID=A0A843VA09_COLES|nr:hypothetical protein [Colocasia esculenta]